MSVAKTLRLKTTTEEKRQDRDILASPTRFAWGFVTHAKSIFNITKSLLINADQAFSFDDAQFVYIAVGGNASQQ